MKNILSIFIFLTLTLQAQDHQFVQNKGQWPSEVRYAVQLNTAQWVFITQKDWRFNFKDSKQIAKYIGGHAENKEVWPEKINNLALFYQFEGANYQDLSAEEPTEAYSNYFLNNEIFVGGAKEYKRLKYANIYPGIDALLKIENGAFKYDLIVHPGADIGQVALKIKGADVIKLSGKRLAFKSDFETIEEYLPIAYQWVDGERKEIDVAYRQQGNVLGYDLGSYDPNLDVVIDPVLIFSTYSGSTSDNFGYTASFDKTGHLYSGSTVFGVAGSYPTTPGVYSTTFAGGLSDIGITKYALDGTSRIYSTYLGGSFDELPHSIVVNDYDELYLFGTTSSGNFPMLSNSWDNSFAGGTFLDLTQGLGMRFDNGSDMFVVKFSADATTLLGSTFIGGSGNDGINRTVAGGVATNATLKYNYADEVRGEVLIDLNNNVYVVSCTRSTDFPVDTTVFQQVNNGSLEGVIVKFDQNLSSKLWSSYIGGPNEDALYSIAFDNAEHIIVAGGTQSSDLYLDTNSVYPNYQGGRSDGFVARIDKNGQQVNHFSYWGAQSYDQVYFVESDRFDNIYLFGQTENVGSQMIENALYNVVNGGQFITKLTPELDSVIWSTTFGTGGGRPNISPTSFLVDYCSKIYLAGWGGLVNTSLANDNNSQSVTGLPITTDAYKSSTDGSDFYIMVIEDDASALSYGSFFGGNISAEHVDGGTSRFDRSGKIYQSVCAGCGSNDDFPTTPGAVSSTNNALTGGRCNNGVFKFDFELPVVIADFLVDPIICLPQVTIPNNISQNANGFFWDFGDGFTSTDANPSHTYTTSGVYTITLVADNNLTCNFNDTIRRTVTILASDNRTEQDIYLCLGDQVQLGFPSSGSGVVYQWTPATGLSSDIISNPVATPISNITYVLEIDAGLCKDTITYPIVVSDVQFSAGPDTNLCSGNFSLNFEIETGHQAGTQYIWSLNADFSNPIFQGVDLTQITHSFNTSQTIFVKGILNGCEYVDTINIIVGGGFVDVNAPNFICYNDTALAIVEVSDPNYTYVYNWLDAQGILSSVDQDSAWLFPDQDTFFVLQTYITELDCYTYDTVNINVSNLNPSQIVVTPNLDTIYQGASTVFQYSPQNTMVQVSPSNSVTNIQNGEITVSPETSTQYIVDVSDGVCTYRTSFDVVVLEFICGPPNIEVPNAFTPNGDGVNDQALVLGNAIETMQFTIYDRWGNVMFETNNISEGWDGKYKDRWVDPAVYVYHLEGTCVNGDEYLMKGNITVIK